MLELPIVLSTSFCLPTICHSSHVCAVVFLMKENNIFWYSCLYQKWENKKTEKALFPEKWMRAIHHSTCICFAQSQSFSEFEMLATELLAPAALFVLSAPSQVGQLIHPGEQALRAAGHLALPKGTQFSSSPSLQLPPPPCPEYTSVRFLPRRPVLS